MKQLLKKKGTICFALVLLCSLSACSEKKSTVQIQKDVGSPPVFLNFFSPNPLSDSDVGKYWSDRFAETYHQTIYVNYDGASYYADEGLSYRELLENRLKSSMPDDLYIINAEDVIEFEKKGYWMDLSEMDFVDHLTESALYQSTYNNKVFSIPLSYTGFGFYWNVDMLEEHSLAVPENLGQFWNVCKELTKAGILPYGANMGYALTVPAMCKGLAKLYQSEDKEQLIADLNSGSTSISTYLEDGFKFLQKMIVKGYMDPQQALNTVPGEELEMFLAGKCAFICTTLGATLQDPENSGFQAELTGVPVLSDRNIAVYGTDLRLCVNPDSKNLETALQFIEMVGTTEALDQSAILNHTMSTAKHSKAAYTSSEQKMCELLLRPDQIPNQDFALHFNTWENIRNTAREICSGITIEKTCRKLDKLQHEELKEYSSD